MFAPPTHRLYLLKPLVESFLDHSASENLRSPRNMAGGRPQEKFPATLDTTIQGFNRADIADLRYHRVLVNDTPTNRLRRKKLEDAILLAQDHNGFTRDWFACFTCCQLMPHTYFYYGQTNGNFEIGGVQEKSRQCYDCISVAADEASGRVLTQKEREDKTRRRDMEHQVINIKKAELKAQGGAFEATSACFCNRNAAKCRADFEEEKKRKREWRERYGPY